MSLEMPQSSYDTSGVSATVTASGKVIGAKSPKRSGLFGLRRKTKPVCTCHLYAQWIREQQNQVLHQQNSVVSHPENCQYQQQQLQQQQQQQHQQQNNFAPSAQGISSQFGCQPFAYSNEITQNPLSYTGGNSGTEYSYSTQNTYGVQSNSRTNRQPFLNVPLTSDINIPGSVTVSQAETRSPELYLYRRRMASQDSGGYDYGTGSRVRRWSGESSRFSVTESDNAYFQPKVDCNCSRCQRDKSKRAVSFGPSNTLLYPLDDPNDLFGTFSPPQHKPKSQLTTELLPLDTQIPLQFQMMSDSAMMCNLV